MRKNIDNAMSEWLIVCGVAVAVIIALAVVASQQRSIWQQEQAQMQAVEQEQRAIGKHYSLPELWQRNSYGVTAAKAVVSDLQPVQQVLIEKPVN